MRAELTGAEFIFHLKYSLPRIDKRYERIAFPVLETLFIEGERDSLDYMKGLLSDWQARNITSVLHEKRGGYANNLAAVEGLAKKATALCVEIITGVEVTGFRSAGGGSAISSG